MISLFCHFLGFLNVVAFVVAVELSLSTLAEADVAALLRTAPPPPLAGEKFNGISAAAAAAAAAASPFDSDDDVEKVLVLYDRVLGHLDEHGRVTSGAASADAALDSGTQLRLTYIKYYILYKCV